MMALDSESIADEDDDFGDDEPSDALVSAGGPEPMKATLGRLRFSVLLQTIQQDTQTRLVFRAQAVIQSEVLHFVPSVEDLKYPEKLDAHKDEGLTLWTEDERLRETEVGGFRMPREEVQVTWYPTLKRTVWVLSKLNTYVNVSSLSPYPRAPNANCPSPSRRPPSSKTLRARPSPSVANRCPPPLYRSLRARPRPRRMASSSSSGICFC